MKEETTNASATTEIKMETVTPTTTTAPASKLSEWFPRSLSPRIISAPMFGSANGVLASEVSKAGGIGFIGGGFLFSPGSPQLVGLASELSAARKILDCPEGESRIPVGVGFILCHESTASFVETVVPVLVEHRPAAVWLFAPRPEDVESGVVKAIVTELRAQGFAVWFQVGTVQSARRAAQDGSDVLVVQGADAGGHGFGGGAGMVSLVVEVKKMVEDEFSSGGDGERQVAVVAAGGIVEGAGVAAALALGAEGAVMGTRFLLAEEAGTPEFRRRLLIESRDGGPATYKSEVMDDIQATGIWPKVYDGRALRTDSVRDHIAGMGLEENVRLFNEAKAKGETGRMITWAGTGVGLLTKVQPAGEIVKEVRAEALARIRNLSALYKAM